MLVEHIEPLRSAMRLTRRRYPFALDAIVVLPDHLHVVMTLQKRTQTSLFGGV
jgi:putative transposase